jgi:hypothetical protein
MMGFEKFVQSEIRWKKVAEKLVHIPSSSYLCRPIQ